MRRTTRPSARPADRYGEDDFVLEPSHAGVGGASKSHQQQARKGIAVGSTPMGDLRKGKWVPEEEAFAGRIIQLFNLGLLAIPTGTTLRSHLSEKLSWYVTPFA